MNWLATHRKTEKERHLLTREGGRGSVADPDPPDPRVFGPPGSGFTSQRYGSGSGSFYHHAKIVTLFEFLSLKNDVK
jgi:hypothetical protein